MCKDASVDIAGHRVPGLGLGLARPFLGHTSDDRSVDDLIDYALDSGLRYLDTARAYTTPDHDSRSEAVIGAALRRRGAVDDILVSTKGGHFRRDDEWPIDARPEALRRDCEASLRWLGRDALDLYFLHFPDPAVPLAESVGALHDLRATGSIRTIGLCNVTVDQLDAAVEVTEIGAVQNSYSAYDMRSDAVIARCGELGIPFVAYSPLGGAPRTRPVHEVSPSASRIAAERGIDVESVLLAWVIGRSPTMIALTGSSRRTTLDSSMAALDLTLSAEDAALVTADLTTGRE